MKENKYIAKFWERFKAEIEDKGGRVEKNLESIQTFYQGYLHGLLVADRVTQKKEEDMQEILNTAILCERNRKNWLAAKQG